MRKSLRTGATISSVVGLSVVGFPDGEYEGATLADGVSEAATDGILVGIGVVGERLGGLV